ncbi:MAG TPA: hypothetical protein VLF40_03015 [Candidatus Saccharimonadales bacterium]|nr:hypothetical protein [Candidatus Saccharimonadales bacterium]
MAEEPKPAQPTAGGDKKPSDEQATPKDALEKTNEELGESGASETTTNADGTTPAPGAKPAKKPNAIKAFLKRFNVYLLLFLLVVIIAAAVSIVSYLNSKKAPKVPNLTSKNLTQEDLKNLANSDATVGDTGQTLTVQGNAVFSGQVLVRSNLNVAGTIQLGGTFEVPDLIVSNTANLGTTQIASLQVQQGSTLQGLVTLQAGLNVAGAADFNGPVTVGQLTATHITMSGNGVLEVPNHISFTGASPGRQINPSVLGVGGSASINGSDTTGTININSGSGPIAGCFLSVTFNKPFTSTPHVIVSPVNSTAGNLNYYVTRDVNGFSLCTTNAAAGNQTFAFDYFITS